MILRIAACVLTLQACDRRVTEPSPGDRPDAAPKPVPVPVQSTTAASQDVPEDRCVHPTPAEPSRPATGPATECPADPEERPELRRGEMRFTTGGARVRVEIAEKDPHRLRGLMYRTSLGEDEGMLFVFEQRRTHRFWMKNTCIPLDMLFIDYDGLIVGIEENVPTLNQNNYQVPCPSQYVLEVNAGWTRKHGVRAGQRVELPGG
jgi:uncharacterized membrane protein (UPF0127 family)